jgi:transporter family protein
MTWMMATACMAYGMGVLKLLVSIIAPLTNSNALIAVLVAPWPFPNGETSISRSSPLALC